jgi:hypothetical protein
VINSPAGHYGEPEVNFIPLIDDYLESNSTSISLLVSGESAALVIAELCSGRAQMIAETRKFIVLIIAAALWASGSFDALADGVWRVAKSSGEVWVMRGDTQLVALNSESVLSPGDNIRTGRNGRAMLARGKERILISPNSAIGIPAAGQSDLPTTIIQQAGSILLEVEKKNVQHFEVETPYLAAVVKGTTFRVTVSKTSAQVDVLDGRVQVSDFKSGQQIVLLPGQAAKASVDGSTGLLLSGKGQFNPVEQGRPRASGLRALSVPKGGLRPPVLGGKEPGKAASGVQASSGKIGGVHRLPDGGIRIGRALGEVKLDYHKVTNGLAHAHGESHSPSGGRRSTNANAYATDSDKPNAAIGYDGSGGAAIALDIGAGNGNGVGKGSGGTSAGVGVGVGAGGGGGLSLGASTGGGGGTSLGLGVGASGGGGLSVGASTGGGATSLALGVGAGAGGGLSVGAGAGGGTGISVDIGAGSGGGLSLGVGGGAGLVLGLGRRR